MTDRRPVPQENPTSPARREFVVTEETRPRRAPDVREFPLGEAEVMLFAEGRQVVHALNASAWVIWELCDGSRSLDDIVRELATEIERAPADLAPEITAAIQELGALGLLDAG